MKNLMKLFIVVLFILIIINIAESRTVPDKIILNSIEKDFPAVSFNHKNHEAMAGDCAMCHHMHPTNNELTRCHSCHNLSNTVFKESVVNTFLPCKSCHGTYNIGSPSIPDLKVAYHQKCFTCHKNMGNIGKDPKGCLEICHILNKEKDEEVSKK